MGCPKQFNGICIVLILKKKIFLKKMLRLTKLGISTWVFIIFLVVSYKHEMFNN